MKNIAVTPGAIAKISQWVDISSSFTAPSAVTIFKAIYNKATKEVKIYISFSNLGNASSIPITDSKYYPNTDLVYQSATNTYILNGLTTGRWSSATVTTSTDYFATVPAYMSDTHALAIYFPVAQAAWGQTQINYIAQ